MLMTEGMVVPLTPFTRFWMVVSTLVQVARLMVAFGGNGGGNFCIDIGLAIVAVDAGVGAATGVGGNVAAGILAQEGTAVRWRRRC